MATKRSKEASATYTLSSSSEDDEPEVKLPASKSSSSKSSTTTTTVTATSRRKAGTSSSNGTTTTSGSDTPMLGALINSQTKLLTCAKYYLDIEKRKIGSSFTRDQHFQYYNQLLILDYLNQDDRGVDLPIGLANIFNYFSEVTGVHEAKSSLIKEILGEQPGPSTSILPPPSTPSKKQLETEVTTPISEEEVPKKRKSIKRGGASSSKKAKTETPKRTPIRKPKTAQVIEPPTLESDDELDDGQYRVEKLVGKRTRRKKVEYLVKWAGYPDSDNTWEPLENISEDLIHNFEQENRKKK